MLLLVLILQKTGSLSARRAWIEITQRRDFKALGLPSLSARRAWIEISGSTKPSARRAVALRKESVDRNDDIFRYLFNGRVALRKESVDRNCWRSHSRRPNIPVALRKESVDRNHTWDR